MSTDARRRRRPEHRRRRTTGRSPTCVANAPGGPIHVLLSDREAEHIPGCNMAFRTAGARGDRRLRPAVPLGRRRRRRLLAAAGARAGRIGFSPAAVVWHHRRNSVRALLAAAARLRQGRGAARAQVAGEVQRRRPRRRWAGRLYGDGARRGARSAALAHLPRHLGQRPLPVALPAAAGRMLGSLPLMPEWYLRDRRARRAVARSGSLWTPLLVALPLLVVAVAALALRGRAGAPRARAVRAARPAAASAAAARAHGRASTCSSRSRASSAGFAHGLTPWRRRAAPRRSRCRCRGRCAVWSEHWQSRRGAARARSRRRCGRRAPRSSAAATSTAGTSRCAAGSLGAARVRARPSRSTAAAASSCASVSGRACRRGRLACSCPRRRALRGAAWRRAARGRPPCSSGGGAALLARGVRRRSRRQCAAGDRGCRSRPRSSCSPEESAERAPHGARHAILTSCSSPAAARGAAVLAAHRRAPASSLLATPLAAARRRCRSKIAVDSVLGWPAAARLLRRRSCRTRVAELAAARCSSSSRACSCSIVLLTQLQALVSYVLQTVHRRAARAGLPRPALPARPAPVAGLPRHARAAADSIYRIQYDAPAIQYIVDRRRHPVRHRRRSRSSAMLYVTAAHRLAARAGRAGRRPGPVPALARLHAARLRSRYHEVEGARELGARRSSRRC